MAARAAALYRRCPADRRPHGHRRVRRSRAGRCRARPSHSRSRHARAPGGGRIRLSTLSRRAPCPHRARSRCARSRGLGTRGRPRPCRGDRRRRLDRPRTRPGRADAARDRCASAVAVTPRRTLVPPSPAHCAGRRHWRLLACRTRGSRAAGDSPARRGDVAGRSWPAGARRDDPHFRSGSTSTAAMSPPATALPSSSSPAAPAVFPRRARSSATATAS